MTHCISNRFQEPVIQEHWYEHFLSDEVVQGKGEEHRKRICRGPKDYSQSTQRGTTWEPHRTLRRLTKDSRRIQRGSTNHPQKDWQRNTHRGTRASQRTPRGQIQHSQRRLRGLAKHSQSTCTLDILANIQSLFPHLQPRWMNGAKANSGRLFIMSLLDTVDPTEETVTACY